MGLLRSGLLRCVRNRSVENNPKTTDGGSPGLSVLYFRDFRLARELKAGPAARRLGAQESQSSVPVGVYRFGPVVFSRNRHRPDAPLFITSTGFLVLGLLPSKYLIEFAYALVRGAVVTNCVTKRRRTDPPT